MPLSHAINADPWFTVDEASLWNRTNATDAADPAQPRFTGTTPHSTLIADALWSASLTGEPFQSEGAGLRGAYRSQMFHPLALRTYRLSSERRNPRASRALMHLLERLGGIPSTQTTHPYSHIVGGKESVGEYEATRNQSYALPYVLVAGYPRSGTTTLQNLVRTIYPSHFVESETRGRISLWQAAKHEIQVTQEIAKFNSEEAVILIAMRNFRDAAASLLVARGSNPTDLQWEAERWREWSTLLGSKNVTPIAFEDVSSKSPHELSLQLAQQSRVELETQVTAAHTHSQLYELARERDVSDHRKSNLPNAERRQLLAEARAYVASSIEPCLLGELDDIYSSVVSTFSSARLVN